MSSITHARGNGGLEKIVVDHPQAEGEVYLHGAHVTHWQPRGAEAVLWMSPLAVFKDGTPIRGGVPVCLPWFGPHPASSGVATDAPAHGLVRTRAWELVSTDEDADGVSVRLRTEIAADASPHWTHAFTAEMSVYFGRTLAITLAVTNTGPQAFDFAEAVHTYFRVRDVREVSVAGLNGAMYVDKMAGPAPRRETAEAITFAAETDRVYTDTAATCVINDQHLGRRIFVEKTGSRSTVVWNPFPAKAARQSDVGADNWPGFVCVETANCATDSVTLAAGATHEMGVTLRLEPVENA